MEWPQRAGARRGVGPERRPSPTPTSSGPPRRGRFKDWHDLFLFGTVADRIADRFGTKGSPISLSTACSSGATAIQLGVEAIRRGEMEAALCIGTDGSVNPESLVRFSLLSALSTQNDPPEGAAKPFSKNRDGFVMGEGAAALVLENAEARAGARRRDPRLRARLRREGRRLPPHALEPGRRADHRRDPRGASTMPGLTPDDIDYVNAHGTGTPENDKMEAMGCTAVFGERMKTRADLVEQVDGRAHADGGGRGRGGGLAPDHRQRPHPADHQLPRSGSGDPARRRAERGARRRSSACCRTRSASAARTPASSSAAEPERDASRVLVTGGGKGVGAAIVRALAAAGHDVDFTYRSSARAAAGAGRRTAPRASGPQRRRHAARSRRQGCARRLLRGDRGRDLSSASSTMPASPTTRSPP